MPAITVLPLTVGLAKACVLVAAFAAVSAVLVLAVLADPLGVIEVETFDAFLAFVWITALET